MPVEARLVRGATTGAGAKPKLGPTTGGRDTAGVAAMRTRAGTGASRRTRTDAGTIAVTRRSSCARGMRTTVDAPVMVGAFFGAIAAADAAMPGGGPAAERKVSLQEAPLRHM